MLSLINTATLVPLQSSVSLRSPLVIKKTAIPPSSLVITHPIVRSGRAIEAFEQFFNNHDNLQTLRKKVLQQLIDAENPLQECYEKTVAKLPETLDRLTKATTTKQNKQYITKFISKLPKIVMQNSTNANPQQIVNTMIAVDTFCKTFKQQQLKSTDQSNLSRLSQWETDFVLLLLAAGNNKQRPNVSEYYERFTQSVEQALHTYDRLQQDHPTVLTEQGKYIPFQPLNSLPQYIKNRKLTEWGQATADVLMAKLTKQPTALAYAGEKINVFIPSSSNKTPNIMDYLRDGYIKYEGAKALENLIGMIQEEENPQGLIQTLQRNSLIPSNFQKIVANLNTLNTIVLRQLKTTTPNPLDIQKTKTFDPIEEISNLCLDIMKYALDIKQKGILGAKRKNINNTVALEVNINNFQNLCQVVDISPIETWEALIASTKEFSTLLPSEQKNFIGTWHLLQKATRNTDFFGTPLPTVITPLALNLYLKSTYKEILQQLQNKQFIAPQNLMENLIQKLQEQLNAIPTQEMEDFSTVVQNYHNEYTDIEQRVNQAIQTQTAQPMTDLNTLQSSIMEYSPPDNIHRILFLLEDIRFYSGPLLTNMPFKRYPNEYAELEERSRQLINADLKLKRLLFSTMQLSTKITNLSNNQ